MTHAGMGDNVSGYAWSETIGWVSMNCSDESGSWAWFDDLSSPDELHGYGWSDNVGWISLNCAEGGAGNTDICGMADYQVRINESTGVLSGYAWTDTLGWITFNRSDTGVPPEAPYNGAESYIAHYDSATKEFSGWARVYNPSGWDGWIKLDDAGWTGMSVTDADRLDGWAWGGSVIGWITFQDGCAFDYGVHIDPATGDFSGYAWSSNVGWIDVDPAPDFTTYPGVGYPTAAEAHAARLESDSTVTGWVRACTGTITNDCTSVLPRADGWDGWISMSGSSPDYGVVYNGADELEGWAWGGDVIGWMSFNAINCDTDEDGFSEGVGGCPVSGGAYWDKIDDLQTGDDGLNTYIYTDSTTWVSGTYEFDDVPAAIRASQTPSMVGYTLIAAGGFQPFLHLNGNETAGSTIESSGWSTPSMVNTSDPPGPSTTWTWDDIDALKIRFAQKESVWGDQGRLTQLFLTVTHSGGTLYLYPNADDSVDAAIEPYPAGGGGPVAIPDYAVKYVNNVNSAPSANINLPAAGNTYPSPVTLSAIFSDPDGMSETFYAYKWYWGSPNATCEATPSSPTLTGYAPGVWANTSDSQVIAPDGDYEVCLMVADGNIGDANQWSSCECVNITVGTECNDGKDNDVDTYIDANDPGCWTDPTDPATYDSTDNDESDAFECNDNMDNDGDNLFDDGGGDVNDADHGCYDNFDAATGVYHPEYDSEQTCGEPRPSDGLITCDPGETFGNCPSDCRDEFNFKEF